MMSSGKARSFWQDPAHYALRIREFSARDWGVYAAWVGLMLGLLFSVSFFLYTGVRAGVEFPAYVWNIPLGIFVFVAAIAFDTIGHRPAYREEIAQGEDLVHHIPIFAGVASVVTLCLAYQFPDFLRIPALVLVALSIFYSAIDEALHWQRYLRLHSDRIEMWSHFFIFVGHIVMSLAWWKWFESGYPGVAATIPYLSFL